MRHKTSKTLEKKSHTHFSDRIIGSSSLPQNSPTAPTHATLQALVKALQQLVEALQLVETLQLVEALQLMKAL